MGERERGIDIDSDDVIDLVIEKKNILKDIDRE